MSYHYTFSTAIAHVVVDLIVVVDDDDDEY
jgi:hypothetical protein